MLKIIMQAGVCSVFMDRAALFASQGIQVGLFRCMEEAMPIDESVDTMASSSGLFSLPGRLFFDLPFLLLRLKRYKPPRSAGESEKDFASSIERREK